MPDITLTENLNILSDNAFHFEIRELPTVSLFAQNFSIPGIALGRATVPTPNIDYSVPGHKLEFEDMIITFMVDEYLKNYMEIVNWMVALGFPESSKQFKDMKEHKTPYTEMSDIILTTTTNKFNVANRIKFIDCFPADISPIDFSSVNTTVSPVVSTVTFAYSYFVVEPVTAS